MKAGAKNSQKTRINRGPQVLISSRRVKSGKRKEGGLLKRSSCRSKRLDDCQGGD